MKQTVEPQNGILLSNRKEKTVDNHNSRENRYRLLFSVPGQDH